MTRKSPVNRSSETAQRLLIDYSAGRNTLADKAGVVPRRPHHSIRVRTCNWRPPTFPAFRSLGAARYFTAGQRNIQQKSQRERHFSVEQILVVGPGRLARRPRSAFRDWHDS